MDRRKTPEEIPGSFFAVSGEKKPDSAKISSDSAEISARSENAAQQKCRRMCYNVSSCNGRAAALKTTKEKNKALYETNR